MSMQSEGEVVHVTYSDWSESVSSRPSRARLRLQSRACDGQAELHLYLTRADNQFLFVSMGEQDARHFHTTLGKLLERDGAIAKTPAS
jgi:hypothetical protein